MGDIRRWVREKGGKPADVALYVNNVLSLHLRSSSMEVFQKLYDDFSGNWSQVCVESIDKHIKNDILAHSVRWVIEPLGWYNPLSGITNNISEGSNTVLKRICELKFMH